MPSAQIHKPRSQFEMKDVVVEDLSLVQYQISPRREVRPVVTGQLKKDYEPVLVEPQWHNDNHPGWSCWSFGRILGIKGNSGKR